MERMRISKYGRLEHRGGLRPTLATGDHEGMDVRQMDACHVNVGAMPFGGEGRTAKVLDRLRRLQPAILVAASRYSRTEGPTQFELQPEQLSMERIGMGKKSVVEVPVPTVIDSMAKNSRSTTNGRRVAGSSGRGRVPVPPEPQVTDKEVQVPLEAGRDHWSVPIELFEDPRYGEITLDDLLVGWERALKEREKPMSEETIQKYMGAVRSFMTSLKAHKKPAILKSLSRNNVLQWLADQRGDKVYGERLSECGIASRLSAVKVFSNTFIFREKQLTKVDLLESVKRFQPDERTKPGLPQEEFQKVMDHFDLKTFTGVRNRALVAVYAATGLRLSALVNLTMTRLNIATGELRVITKGKKEHLVCLSKNAMKDLMRYLKWRPKTADHDRVWVDETGRPIGKTAVSSMFRRLREATGVEINCQRLRHGFAQAASRKGARPEEVRDMMGHSNVKVTMGYIGDAWKETSAKNVARYSPY